LEVDFSPLGGNPIGLNQIKFRSFTTETTALRLGVFIGYGSEKTVTAQEGVMEMPVSTGASGTETNPLLQDTDGNFTLNLRPGYEMHFAGTERLSPYVGGEALIGFSTMSSKEEAWGYGAFSTDNNQLQESGLEVWETTTKDGMLTLGLNAVAGCDFYFANSIYMGFEFGFGLAVDNQLKTKTEFSNLDAYGLANFQVNPDDNGTFVNNAEQPTDAENGSTFNIGPNVNGGIRLGFAF